MKKYLNDTYLILALVIITAGSVLGCLLCTLLSLWIVDIAIGICLMSAILCYVFYKYKKEELYKSLLVFCVLCLCVVWLYVFCEKTGFVNIFLVGDVPNRNEVIQQNLLAYMESTGKWAVLVFILLQFLQTTILPIPSFATTGAGALLCTELYGNALGPLYNSIFSLIGILLGSFVAFFIGRLFGSKLVEWIIGKEKLYKIMDMIKGKDAIILTAMFVLPFFPDDVLCFVAGLSSMTTKYFSVVIVVSRVLVVFGTSYLFGLIPLTTWWGLLIWGVFILVILLAFLCMLKNREKLEKLFTEKFCKTSRNQDNVNENNQETIDKQD